LCAQILVLIFGCAKNTVLSNGVFQQAITRREKQQIYKVSCRHYIP